MPKYLYKQGEHYLNTVTEQGSDKPGEQWLTITSYLFALGEHIMYGQDTEQE